MRAGQMRMVVILIIGAVILAVASFLLMMMLARRPDPAVDITINGEPLVLPGAGQTQLFIDDTVVTINPDPLREIRLRDELPPMIVVPQAAPEEPTPIVVVVEPVAPTPQPAPPLIVVDPAPPVAMAPATSPVIFIDYLVQPGDTLYGVAARNNSSIELMALHGIASDNLVAGTTIRLPVANPAFCPGRRPYIVRDKDTVFRIAGQFNTSAQIIRDLNGLSSDYRIEVTQVLCVP
jgi:LysM repeat protein